MCKEMLINDNTDILLSIVWINSNEKELMNMFYKLFIEDAIENMNMEKVYYVCRYKQKWKMHMEIYGKKGINEYFPELFIVDAIENTNMKKRYIYVCRYKQKWKNEHGNKIFS